VLGFVVTESLNPTCHVAWEGSSVLGSGPGDFVSELSDESDDLLDGGTISGLGQHGESVDEWEVG